MPNLDEVMQRMPQEMPNWAQQSGLHEESGEEARFTASFREACIAQLAKQEQRNPFANLKG